MQLQQNLEAPGVPDPRSMPLHPQQLTWKQKRGNSEENQQVSDRNGVDIMISQT